jgi:hypothetical protein
MLLAQNNPLEIMRRKAEAMKNESLQWVARNSIETRINGYIKWCELLRF